MEPGRRQRRSKGSGEAGCEQPQADGNTRGEEKELLNKLCEAEHVLKVSPLTLPETGPQRLASALWGGSSGSHPALGTGRSLPQAAAPPHRPTSALAFFTATR